MAGKQLHGVEQTNNGGGADFVMKGGSTSNQQINATAWHINNVIPYNATQTGGHLVPVPTALPPSPPQSPPSSSTASSSSAPARSEHIQTNYITGHLFTNVQFNANAKGVNNLPQGATPPEASKTEPRTPKVKTVIENGTFNGGQLNLGGGQVNNW